MIFTVKVQDGAGIYIDYTVEAASQAALDAYLVQSIPSETIASNYASALAVSGGASSFYQIYPSETKTVALGEVHLMHEHLRIEGHYVIRGKLINV